MLTLRVSSHLVLPVASTGIASNLLSGGRTYFSMFGLPVPLTETSVSQIKGNSKTGKLLKNAKLIIWDEVTMATKVALDAVDRLFRDLRNTDTPFGGVVVLLGGDFRQTLPVVKHGGRVATVESTIKFSLLWPKFKQFKLRINQRVQEDNEFSDWLERMGNGELPGYSTVADTIEIPAEMLENVNLVNTLFGYSFLPEQSVEFASRAILCPKNDDVENINSDVLKRLHGDLKVYKSIDAVVGDDHQEVMNFPVEFLNSLTPSGMPPHVLKLKVGAIVMLLRNLNTKRNLCNGTRMIVRALMPHTIHAEILTGNGKGKHAFIPRIDLNPSDTDLPFRFKRRQFPVKLAWAMTINKSQGQTLDMVGIYLPNPVFSHGQLYVACSRVRSKGNIKVRVLDTERQGLIDKKSDKVYTVNCVYKEILN